MEHFVAVMHALHKLGEGQAPIAVGVQNTQQRLPHRPVAARYPKHPEYLERRGAP
jgi:hypothetical protein